MYRTHCRTYAECRRTLPWAVAIWTLFPLSYIEIVMDVDKAQFELDNDLILDTLSQTFNRKYFAMYTRVHNDVHAADLFPRFPCTYMVYMHPSFVPYSRDFVNTHITTIAHDTHHRPIVHWHGTEVAIVVAKAKPHMLVFRESPRHRTIYVEVNFVIRAIENMDTLHDIQQYLGDHIVDTGTEYLSKLPKEEDFTQADMAKIVADSPSVPQVPCSIHTSNGDSTSGGGSASGICYMPRGLIIDALFIPEHHTADDDMPDASPAEHSSVDNTSSGNISSDAVHSAHTHAFNTHITEPHIWLTSSTPRIPVSTILHTYSQAEIEEVVTHLDPILQNAMMQKILAFIPEDIMRVLRHLDAVLYPNVVSMIDAHSTHWGGKCNKKVQ